ncbi:unnamed protein product [Prorocentrum cordatum]|uniref:Uncharacterized protein n=1 Tax=Prorocentrum cordatum TaxID=2364126 RepID=A0ABN9XI98_9DINO|nr:unnamed protein product [Polarella glacialis]
MSNNRSCSFRARLAVRAAAGVVHPRQEAACPKVAAVVFGQHWLLGILPIFQVPMSGVQALVFTSKHPDLRICLSPRPAWAKVELPMLLLEGLEEDGGDTEYFWGKLKGSPESLEELAAAALEGGLAAQAQVDARGGTLELITTRRGKAELEERLPSLGGRGFSSGDMRWTPVGGNFEYLLWVSQQAGGCGGGGEFQGAGGEHRACSQD